MQLAKTVSPALASAGVRFHGGADAMHPLPPIFPEDSSNDIFIRHTSQGFYSIRMSLEPNGLGPGVAALCWKPEGFPAPPSALGAASGVYSGIVPLDAIADVMLGKQATFRKQFFF